MRNLAITTAAALYALAASGGEYDDAAPTIKELVEDKRRHLKGETGQRFTLI